MSTCITKLFSKAPCICTSMTFKVSLSTSADSSADLSSDMSAGVSKCYRISKKCLGNRFDPQSREKIES